MGGIGKNESNEEKNKENGVNSNFYYGFDQIIQIKVSESEEDYKSPIKVSQFGQIDDSSLSHNHSVSSLDSPNTIHKIHSDENLQSKKAHLTFESFKYDKPKKSSFNHEKHLESSPNFKEFNVKAIYGARSSENVAFESHKFLTV